MRFFFLFPAFFFSIDALFSQAPAFKLDFGNLPLGIDTPCTNMDFEECTFNGWTLSMGNVPGGMPYSYSYDSLIAPGTQHTITNYSGNDSIAPIPFVFPGGNCSMRLGDGLMTGAKAAKLKQTFFVDSISTFLTFRYAAVLQDPSGHTVNEKPYFRINVYDSTGNSIPCGQYNVISGPASSGGDPAFIASTYNGEVLYYKNWTTGLIDLDGYSGQNLTIEYIVGDCAQGGHFGYAYIDGLCGYGEGGITREYSNGCNFPVNLQAIEGSSYQWNTGDTSRNISVNSNGVYSVTVTTGNGCTKNFSIDLQNNISAIADFSFNDTCVGFPVSFTDLSSVSGGAITGWQWDFGDNTGFSFQQNPQHTFDSAGTFAVTLSFTTGSGCTEDTNISITIPDSYIPSITGPDTVCANDDEFLFSASHPGGFWAGAGITDTINGVFNPSAAGAGTHVVYYNNSGNCTDTGLHQIVVQEAPTLLVDSVHHISCFGGNEGAFFTSGSGGATPYSYLWGNGCLSCVPYNLIAGTYLYFVSDANGCQDSSEIIVTQPDPIQIFISGSSETLCEGESTVMAVNITGGVFPFSYQWTSGDTSQVIVANTSQLYKVTVTDGNGCSNVASSSLNFFPSPVVDFGNDTTIPENSIVTLNAGNAGSSFLWNTGETTQVIEVSSTGEYYVIVSDSNDCSGSDTIIVSVISSIPWKIFPGSSRVYPNPANDVLFVEKTYLQEATVIIYNIIGKVVLKFQIANQKSQINISLLPKGIYFLQVSDEKSVNTEKFIRE